MAVKKIVSMCLCVYVSMSQTAQAQDWKKIAKGLSYQQLGDVHVLQIDPKYFRFSVATAQDTGKTAATVKEMAKQSNAILAINGGFFSPEQKSIGLLMREGKTLNPIHPVHWQGIFYIDQQKPTIVPPSSFQNHPGTEMALQVGPRLVIQGRIPIFKPSHARRSGIGIQKDGKIIIAITESEPISIQNFAQLFKNLECIDALNLDGGGSSQLYIDWNGFKKEIPGVSLVTNAITVLPRH